MPGGCPHVLTAGPWEGAVCLSVTEVDGGLVATFVSGGDMARLATAVDALGGTLTACGAGAVARLPGGLAAGPDETAVFAGKRVIVARAGRATAASAAEWLSHHAQVGVGGALIFVEGGPEAGAAFADALEGAVPEGLTPVVVSANLRLTERSPDDPGEDVLVEALRHRFLARAEAVALLDVGDYLFEAAGDPFARAVAAPGKVIGLRGRIAHAAVPEAALADHIYARRDERHVPKGWCADPGGLPPRAVWTMDGVPAVATLPPPTEFVRLMGVRQPGTRVDVASLVEDRVIAARMAEVFGQTPRRRPRRRPAPDRTPVVVVTTMRNEGPYIVDWLAHHRVLGVESFLVYTNDCEDGTEALLAALARGGVVQHRENPYRRLGGAPQRAAFRAAKSDPVVRDAAWLLPLDVDEYLNIRVGTGRMSDLFAAVPEATVISVPWRLFGNADILPIEDRPVTETFRLAAPDYAPRPLQAWAFKSLFLNDGTFRQIGVHAPRRPHGDRRESVVWVDGSGRPLPEAHWDEAWRATPATWGYDLAQINHYAVRSADGFLVKRARGRTNHTGQDQGLDYWFRMNFNGPEERSIDRYAGPVAEDRARLMALPGVAEAHARALDWHHEKAVALKRDPDYAALFAQITGGRMQALSRRLGHFGNNVFTSGPGVVPDALLLRKVGGDWTFTVPLPEDS